MRRTIPLGLALALLATAAGAQTSGDPAAGKFKFDTCTGCHAIPGYTNVYPTYHVPKLGGQHGSYLVAALMAYKKGDRTHPTMIANAAGLTEQDMADIAAYLSSLPGGDGRGYPSGGDAAAGKKKSQACQACHGDKGNSPDPQFPRLDGQHGDYLLKALADYKSGARKNAIMNGMAAGLSAKDQADLAAWYASQGKGLSVVPDSAH